MKQRTLAMMTGFEQYTRKTRRAIFLEEMEQVVPWGELCALVAPHYPQPGKGRRPVGVERMLRIYFLQQWFNLSDPAVEEALYDSAVMRQFVGIDLGCEPVPDEITVCKFRHLLEEHQLGEQILGQVNLHLQAQGVRITTGTIVDATILHAPTSTKNREQQRDPEMHQTKKGKQWYFGMKAHVGVDSKTKIIHTAVATAANVADSAVLPDLLHGEETRVWGDQAYRGQSEVIRECAPQAQDCTHRRYRYKNRIDEVPLFALLRLVHLRIALLLPVLGRSGCVQDGRVHDRARRDPHPLRLQVQVHLSQDLFAQLMFFQQVPELAHRGFVRHRLTAQINAHELPHPP